MTQINSQWLTMYLKLVLDSKNLKLTGSIVSTTAKRISSGSSEYVGRMKLVEQFIAKYCAKPPENNKNLKDLVREHLAAYMGYVVDADVGYAMILGLQQCLLPDRERVRRMLIIDRLICERFAGFSHADEALAKALAELRMLATLYPTAMLESALRNRLIPLSRLLYEGKEFKRPLAYAGVEATLEDLADGAARSGMGADAFMALNEARTRFLLDCPEDQLAARLAGFRALCARNQLSHLLAAERRLSDYGVSENSAERTDALAAIVAAIPMTAPQDMDELISTHAAETVATQRSRDQKAIDASYEFFSRDLNFEDSDFKKSQVSARCMRSFYATWQREALVAAEKLAVSPSTSLKDEERLRMQDWSVQKLAEWIEGPLVEKGKVNLKPVDPKKIAERENTRLMQQPTNVSGAQSKPLQVQRVSDQLVTSVARNALEGTLAFFLAELKDLFAAAEKLGAHGAALTNCQRIYKDLLQVGELTQSDPMKVRLALSEAEQAIESLRLSLKYAKHPPSSSSGSPSASTQRSRTRRFTLARTSAARLTAPWAWRTGPM